MKVSKRPVCGSKRKIAFAPQSLSHTFAFVDIHGICVRAVAGQAPLTPAVRGWIVDAKLAGGPFADPQRAFGIRPDAAWPRAWRGRHNDMRGASHLVDAGDIVAGQRRVIDITARCHGDAVGSRPRRIEHANAAAYRTNFTVSAILSGKPQVPLRVEHGGVQIGIRVSWRERETPQGARGGAARTIAFSPPSVTQAAPSGPTTPCGAAVDLH